MDTKADANFAGEAFAVYAALWHYRDLLQGSTIVIFVDNESAASALIRGTSSQEDVGSVVLAVQWLLHSIDAKAWVEWIDSESNPSDGLSRAGCTDAWTRRQGWELSQGAAPPWSASWDVHCGFMVGDVGIDAKTLRSLPSVRITCDDRAYGTHTGYAYVCARTCSRLHGFDRLNIGFVSH